MVGGIGEGVLFGVIAGSFLGIFALPMKAVRVWRWENTWLMYCFWSLLILPWGLAFLTVPHVLDVMGGVSARALALPFVFGLGWGIACVLFGLGLKLLGIALGTAIVLGLNNALGALLPLLLTHRAEIATGGAHTLAGGVAIMLVGVMLCSWAAKQKEGNSATAGAGRAKGILYCLASGVIGTSFNLALVYGTELNSAALKAGASTLNANNPVWCISLLGGLLPNFAYCSYLLTRNSAWKLFLPEKSRVDWFLAFAMGLMWLSGVAIYGMAVQQLGRFGASVGWALIQSTAIIAGNVSGFATGEWKGAAAKAKRPILAGLVVLILGIVVVGWSATM